MHVMSPHALQAQKPADTASDWKEFTSPDGRKYYHNRKTKESKWVMPEEMKRAQAAAAAATATNGAAGQAQKVTGAAAPQLVKVPVSQSLSPARTSTPAQKSPLVKAYSAYLIPWQAAAATSLLHFIAANTRQTFSWKRFASNRHRCCICCY